MLRKLNEEQEAIKEKESKSSTFIVSIEEDVESVRPAYNYERVQEQLELLEEQVRKVKHAINTFNLTTVIPGFDMTVDQMLVYIPQLNERKNKLNRMAGRLPKERVSSARYGTKTIVEYEYSNYDTQQAEADFAIVANELARAQTALDVVNNSVTMEIELD